MSPFVIRMNLMIICCFQQLHKYTDLEHPDHYYIEQSLNRVGEFLNSLNDSIETSMNLVNSETTPKPKRWGFYRSFGCYFNLPVIIQRFTDLISKSILSVIFLQKAFKFILEIFIVWDYDFVVSDLKWIILLHLLFTCTLSHFYFNLSAYRKLLRLGSLRSNSISSYKDLQLKAQDQSINVDLNSSQASSSGRHVYYFLLNVLLCPTVVPFMHTLWMRNFPFSW